MWQLQGRPLPSAYAATDEERQGAGVGGGGGQVTEGSSLLRGMHGDVVAAGGRPAG